MSLSQQQLEAISLLGKGVPAPRVAYNLGVSYRTLQRWLTKAEFQATLSDLKAQSEAKFVADLSDRIAVDLRAMQREHLDNYGLLREIALTALRHYRKKLIEDGESPEELNTRQISLWVQILDRGIRGEAETGFFRYLDVASAIDAVDKAGYVIYDESSDSPKQMKGFDN